MSKSTKLRPVVELLDTLASFKRRIDEEVPGYGIGAECIYDIAVELSQHLAAVSTPQWRPMDSLPVDTPVLVQGKPEWNGGLWLLTKFNKDGYDMKGYNKIWFVGWHALPAPVPVNSTND